MNTPGEHEYHSFQIVFNTYYNSLCNYACSFLRDKNASEDIVQEVFTRVWERRRDLIGSEEIRYYLFTAVRNNCISQMRKEKKRGVSLAFRIGNRINRFPLRNRFLVQRMDITGYDTLQSFRWSLIFGKKWSRLIPSLFRGSKLNAL